MPSRNALTFSGKAPAASSRSRRIHDSSVPTVASCSRAISSAVSVARELHRRHPGGVQDLVRVRVPDSAEDVRIRERTLHRVILPRQARRECGQIRLQHLEAARVEPSELTSGDQVQRRLPARSRLGQHHRTGRKIERRKSHLARNRSAALAPAEPSGNHQVQHEGETAFELEDDALAQTTKPDDGAAFNRADGWIGRAQKEWIGDAEPLERLVEHPRRERLEIQRDVGQFRHGQSPDSRSCPELPQVMIHVAVDEHPPTLRRHPSERGMDRRHSAGTAANDRLELGAEIPQFRAPLTWRASDQLWRGRQIFRDRQPVERQLLERRVPERQMLRRHREFARCHTQRTTQMDDHLRRTHPAPARRVLGREPTHPLVQFTTIAWVPDRLHRSLASTVAPLPS